MKGLNCEVKAIIMSWMLRFYLTIMFSFFLSLQLVEMVFHTEQTKNSVFISHTFLTKPRQQMQVVLLLQVSRVICTDEVIVVITSFAISFIY